MFKLQSTDGKARAGILKTAHGKVRTPLFMPVATKASFKWVALQDAEKAGVECFISNSYILSLRPGVPVIKKAGGLHKFMNWDKGIFTDSGGFQLISDELFLKMNDSGIYFRNPFDKNRDFLTPEKSMQIQEDIGADVAMALDDMPRYGSNAKRLEESAARTFEWAKRCLDSHNSKKQLLFGIAQGGTNKKRRKKSAEQISSLPFDGFALGGLAVGEPKKKMMEMAKINLSIFPGKSPRYLMGLGSPKELIEAISFGADIFDSCFPTRTARHGLAFTCKGNIDISKGKFKLDLKPLDEKCGCPVCKSHSRSYIHHLFKVKEENGKLLLSTHNIYFITKLMQDARKAILDGKFITFKKKFT
ncbi:MAG: tRNA guanosine(34) transglycosylase Tgt [Candidatus Diapherotrites archaeon]|uniref:tRNA guanosine(34) transglycosylase Tgt n=1 Tax=Candidatus Iainarchaeum sp. TaxID=3101447 RepID=A0A2D6M160_9ARCH|nr:tRNA guanosine(34) transglycosylase Tgt [Candidatus Diapherotrites archaeon]|tara:strand:+ start:1711 stop:2790 length:1080 start_codon:yes stop_codon:yes gene_type:complete